jgi:hypothetical protein
MRTFKRQMDDLRPSMVWVYAPSAVVILFVFGLSSLTGIPVEVFTRDPLAVMGGDFYVGSIFMLRELVFPKYLDWKQGVVLLRYGLLTLAYMWSFRKIVLHRGFSSPCLGFRFLRGIDYRRSVAGGPPSGVLPYS